MAKIALVTGGGRRLGREIALALAAAGYDLLVAYNRSEAGARVTVEDARRLGRRAHAFRADLSLPGEAEAAAAAARGLFGALDVLVNNAGVFAEESVEDASEEAWVPAFRLNVMAPLFLSRAAHPMLRERHGAIVNVGSLGGHLAYPGRIVYSLTKASLAHLTRGLARRFAPEVRVNAVAPGGVRFSPDDPADLLPPLDRIPLGRHARPDEVAALVLFLADRARYVTGQTILLDGGRSIA